MDSLDPLLLQRETLNPYRHAAGEIWRRLAWDCRLESVRSRQSLKRLKDIRKGEKAVILCNGPSLLKTDFEQMKGVYTFGLNKINLLFTKADFRPSCIVSVNRHVIEQNASFFNETDIPLFLDGGSVGLVRPRSNVTYLHASGQRKFARDCSISVYQGATVTFVAMQLAFHMGFQSVALVGCDHTFAAKGPANQTVVAGKIDESHFDTNYFPAGVKWQLPDLFESEVSYEMARQVFSAFGRQLVNATVGGKLEIFPRVDLESFLRS